MKIRDIVAESSDLNEANPLSAIKGIAKGTAPKWAQTVNQFVDKTAAAKAGAGAAIKTTARAGFTLTSAALSFLKAYQLYQPYKDYETVMAKREDQVKRGVLTQVQYEIVREQELTKLVAQWTVILATNGLLRSGVMPFLGGLRLFGLGTVYAFINSLTKAAQLWLMNWWNSEEGRKWVASILAHGVINDQDMISPVVGGNIADLIDRVQGKMRKDKVDSATPTQPPAQTEPSTPADAKPASGELDMFTKDIPAVDKSRGINIDPYSGSWTNR